MIKLVVVEWVSVPLVPVMVSVDVPLDELFAVLMFKVAVPDVLTEVGLKVAVTRLGTPLTVRFTVPVKPFCAAMVTV